MLRKENSKWKDEGFNLLDLSLFSFFLIKMLCMTFLMLSFTVKVLGTISKILVKTMKVDILFKSMHIFDQ